jgi:hypothetical protein
MGEDMARSEKARATVPTGFRKGMEEEGFKVRDRLGKIEKWGEGMEVKGTFLGFKDGKVFGKRTSVLCKIRNAEDGQVGVYSCPAVLENALEDIEVGSELWIVCLGQNLEIKGRKELAWDFEVASKPSED